MLLLLHALSCALCLGFKPKKPKKEKRKREEARDPTQLMSQHAQASGRDAIIGGAGTSGVELLGPSDAARCAGPPRVNHKARRARRNSLA